MCHAPDCSPTVNIPGMCHTTSAAAAASQQNAGCPIDLPTRCTAGNRNAGSMIACMNCCGKPLRNAMMGAPSHIRSEEHTSELQSQSNLVCRLLLEKKK